MRNRSIQSILNNFFLPLINLLIEKKSRNFIHKVFKYVTVECILENQPRFTKSTTTTVITTRQSTTTTRATIRTTSKAKFVTTFKPSTTTRPIVKGKTAEGCCKQLLIQNHQISNLPIDYFVSILSKDQGQVKLQTVYCDYV